jgi:hypothetical protein
MGSQEEVCEFSEWVRVLNIGRKASSRERRGGKKKWEEVDGSPAMIGAGGVERQASGIGKKASPREEGPGMGGYYTGRIPGRAWDIFFGRRAFKPAKVLAKRAKR